MMNDLDRQVSQLNPAKAEDFLDAGGSAEAIALLERILADQPGSVPARGRHRRRVGVQTRWAVGLVAAAAVAALIVALWPFTGPSPSPTRAIGGRETPLSAVRLVVFTRKGNDIVARITDPTAPADQLTAVFRADGLDIHVETLPVSPSLVGTIVYSDVNTIQDLQTDDCLQGGGGACWIGLVIPADFTGSGNVAVGRAAAAGETYDSSAEVFGAGEILHCSGILAEPVATALPKLESMGLSVRWQFDSGDGTLTNESSPPDGYVTGGTGLSSTAVLLEVAPEVPGTDAFHNYEAAANRGC